MKPAAWIALFALAAASCSSPASPAATAAAVDRVTLATGAYEFFAFQMNPPAQCGVSNGLVNEAAIMSHVTLSHEGTEWIARAASPADGDIEVRFHDSGENILAGPANTPAFLNVVATHRGTAVQAQKGAVDGVRFVVDSTGAVPSKGFVILSGASTIYVEGLTSLRGVMTFTNAQATRTCDVALMWALMKPLGSLP